MMSQHYLAFDLGASSGRAVIGSFDGERLSLEECHRFPNGIIRLLGHMHWDVLRLFDEMKQGLSRCARTDRQPLSIGIDTWGVDFGLLGPQKTLLGNPYAYRDPHTDGVMEWAFSQVSREMIFEQTGIQFMPINTLYHLLALNRAGSPLLAGAERFLMMADLFNFFLTGVAAVEFSNATTTQCFNPRTGTWSGPLMDAFDLPGHIFPEVIQPGTTLGPLLPDIMEETGLGPITVVAPATHDTGSAVAAVPAEGDDWAYLSSGTWSLMGIESPKPIITPEALAFNMTNEGGVGNTIRVLKNITGLWLIQECQRIWAREGDELDYDEITRLSETASPFAALIDPDDPALFNPMHMPDAVKDVCRRTGQPVPEDKGAIARCIYESLALKYRFVLDQLSQLRGRPIERLHIIGGGTQSRLLCQYTANATRIPALAGPVEATAIGNIMVQAMTHGAVADLSQLREVVRRSFPVETYEPRDADAWEDAFSRFKALYG